MQQRATPYTPRNGSKVERATLTNVTACSRSRVTAPADQFFFRTHRPPRRRDHFLKGMCTRRCTDATVRLEVDSSSAGHQRQMTSQGPQTAPASEKRTKEGASISSALCGEQNLARRSVNHGSNVSFQLRLYQKFQADTNHFLETVSMHTQANFRESFWKFLTHLHSLILRGVYCYAA